MNIAQRILAARSALGLNQHEFAERIGGFSRNYLSRLETGKSLNPSRKFLSGLSELEAEARVRQLPKVEAYASSRLQENPPKPSPGNVAPGAFSLRLIPVYSFVTAGQATDFEELPPDWDDEISYYGKDPKAFGLRIVGDSMQPEHSPGDIVIVSPRYPATNGDKVVAKIRNQGVLFKIMHHSGDGKRITLSSYNPLYKELEFAREDLHWMYPVTQVTRITKPQ